MLRHLATLVCACALTVAEAPAQRAAAHPTLVEPFHGAQLNLDNFALHPPRGTPLERRALLQADLSGKGFEARGREIRLGPQTIVLVRGWTGEGTGLQQLSYLLFLPVGDSVTLAWSAVAEERSAPPRRFRTADDQPYDLRGCLYVVDDSLVAYVSVGAPAGARALSEPPTRRSGVYALSAASHGLHRVAEAPARAVASCRRTPGAATVGR